MAVMEMDGGYGYGLHLWIRVESMVADTTIDSRIDSDPLMPSFKSRSLGFSAGGVRV